MTSGGDVSVTPDNVVTGRPENIRAVPVRHPWRWVAIAVIAVLAAMLVHMLFTNPNLEWPSVRKYLFSQIILRGVWMTIKLTILSMARSSDSRVTSSNFCSSGAIWPTGTVTAESAK